MNYEELVSSFCEEATQLSKADSYTLFNRWKEEFKKYPYTDRGIGVEDALILFAGTDFYVLFEYLKGRPIGYICRTMKYDIGRIANIDYMLIGADFSWTIMFSHEDGILTKGPYYTNIGAPPNQAL